MLNSDNTLYPVKNTEGEKGYKLMPERILHERNNQEAEQRFRAIFEQSPYGIVIIDTDGKFIEFNEAAHRDCGYTRDEFAKLSITDIDPTQSPKQIRDSMRKILKKGEAAFEVRHRTKEGGIRDVHVITRVVNLSGKRVFQAIWQDITERKQVDEILHNYRAHLEDLVRERTAELARVNEQLQKDISRRRLAEKRLRESEERFRRIFEDGPLGMLILSPNYTILNMNRAIHGMLGYIDHELSGRSIYDITHPEDLGKTVELSAQLLKGAIPLYRAEKRYVRKNGEMLWANIITTAFRDQNGEVICALSMVEDISNRKMAEQERESLIKELQDAMGKIKTLRGLLPTCAWCRKVRDDDGYWKKVETYIEEHSDASFTHGICPDCLKKNDPETYREYKKKIEKEYKTEKRKSDRKSFHEPFSSAATLRIKESKRPLVNVAVCDISDTGACVRTDYPLKTHSVLIFKNGAESKKAVVRWRKIVPEDNSYRVGIKFTKH
jgi:PAS domain S-box-containing protein